MRVCDFAFYAISRTFAYVECKSFVGLSETIEPIETLIINYEEYNFLTNFPSFIARSLCAVTE